MTHFTLGRISGMIMTTVLCGTFAAPSFAQQPTEKRDPQDRVGQDRTEQGQDAQSMAQLKQAHQQMQSAALTTLKQQTKDFFSKNGSDSKQGAKQEGQPDTGSTRNTMAKSVTLDDNKLLIAACAHGLLTGAPSTGWASSTRGTDKAGSTGGKEQDSTTGRSGTGMDSGDTAGMLLVYTDKPGQSTGSSQRGTEEASGRRASGVGDAAMVSKNLKPGIYEVKCTGDAVSLTDESGRVVLRATIDQKSASNRGNTAGQSDRDQPTSGEAGKGEIGKAGGKQNWECVFGAITAEAMNSMGWSPNRTVAASGR